MDEEEKKRLEDMERAAGCMPSLAVMAAEVALEASDRPLVVFVHEKGVQVHDLYPGDRVYVRLGTGGDAFGFVSQREGVSFPDGGPLPL